MIIWHLSYIHLVRMLAIGYCHHQHLFDYSWQYLAPSNCGVFWSLLVIISSIVTQEYCYHLCIWILLLDLTVFVFSLQVGSQCSQVGGVDQPELCAHGLPVASSHCIRLQVSMDPTLAQDLNMTVAQTRLAFDTNCSIYRDKLNACVSQLQSR